VKVEAFTLAHVLFHEELNKMSRQLLDFNVHLLQMLEVVEKIVYDSFVLSRVR
jgi:hypothetical protein